MTKLIVTRGLPASGKTTRARAWVAEDPLRRSRVNRDDLRQMLHDSAYLQRPGNQSTERAVLAVRDAVISGLLRRGVDVVSDDTNLAARTVRDLRRLATAAAAQFEVWDLTDVPYQECARRNALREGRQRVPDEALLDMYTRYLQGRQHPLPVAEQPAAEATAGAVPAVYRPDPALPATVLVDVDGTVALMNGRSPFDESRVHEDLPNTPVITAVRAMQAAGHEVVFCSGRTEQCRTATEKWLADHVAVGYAALYLRPVGDSRKDAVVKTEIFERHIRDVYRVVCVFDDRRQVVEAWRSLGLTVFQVAPGDF
ncbi:MAG: AAA family ATPase [Micromonosporaceae bacterium]|nr:AAA family ATPase [Micromonosporaceae bacterium]